MLAGATPPDGKAPIRSVRRSPTRSTETLSEPALTAYRWRPSPLSSTAPWRPPRPARPTPPVANEPAGDSVPSGARSNRCTVLPLGSLVCVYSEPPPCAIAFGATAPSSAEATASTNQSARERGRGTGMETS